MIKQLLKMLWKQRRSRSGIFVEQLLVALILMLAAVSVSEIVQRYKTPGMLNVDNTFYIDYMCSEDVRPEERAAIRQNEGIIIENLKKLPFVEVISSSYNLIPYKKDDYFYTKHSSDSIFVDDRRFLAVVKHSDEFGATAFKLEMEEGSWLENHTLPDGSAPAVITRQLADKAGWTNAVGKKITLRGKVYTIAGVVAGLKQEPFKPSPVAIVTLLPDGGENLVRIKPGNDQEFIDAFYGEFQRLISDKRVEPILSDMQAMKVTWVSMSILEVMLQIIPTAFLFIFAFIGTFGLSWMLSRRRQKEFGLRIAMGSTPKQLMAIVIGESLLITCIAVVPALLLSFFIYEYTMVHVVGVGVTVGIMLLFSAVSAWYPAWKVSRVNPAEALQYE
ncbi:MAG: FtsX-like permease family protein [Prevotellaceae bacterium]|jgi:hypothetical protein|nr:FtsX-like permease family protein [Prevotellaceae bacterium]